ncbi:MAG: hypothetical protein KDD44_07035, partial [Bdellovibrionales bacterium]|nr:hypothetical protein [Bdellovibrionales bacterium]
VVISGPKSLVDSLTRENISLLVDGSGMGPGKHPVSVRAKLPEGLEVLKTTPETVTLTLAARPEGSKSE